MPQSSDQFFRSRLEIAHDRVEAARRAVKVEASGADLNNPVVRDSIDVAAHDLVDALKEYIEAVRSSIRAREQRLYNSGELDR